MVEILKQQGFWNIAEEEKFFDGFSEAEILAEILDNSCRLSEYEMCLLSYKREFNFIEIDVNVEDEFAISSLIKIKYAGSICCSFSGNCDYEAFNSINNTMKIFWIGIKHYL
ncbi:MAG: hypothetical protein FWC91_10360 [Defluviitaleaceae bacterium]|nr:hypothetical protein [Defluviitaleaceae bacterium]